MTSEKPVGPWAREKLEALRNYLTFFNRVLKNQAWCPERIFIDAFAGPGRSPVRAKEKVKPDVGRLFDEDSVEEEVVEYVTGSPRVALEIPDRFTRYVFVELDSERLGRLEEIKRSYADTRNIEIIAKDANLALRELCDKKRLSKKQHSRRRLLGSFWDAS